MSVMNHNGIALAVFILVTAMMLWPSSAAFARARLPHWSAADDGAGSASSRKTPVWVVRLGAVIAIGAVIATGIAETLAVAIMARCALSVYRSVMARRAATEQLSALTHALESIVGELKTGQTPGAALEIAHRDLQQRSLLRSAAAGPIVRAVGQAVQTTAFGSRWPESAVQAMPQFSRMWQVAQVFGLPMAEMLECYRGDLVARQGHQSKTAAALAGPRLTIAILASLPIFGLVLGQAFGAEPFHFLSSPGIGAIVLVAGVGLSCAGVVWSVQIMSRAEAV